MKKCLPILLILLSFGTTNAQLNIYDFKSYKFESEADYKAAEPMVKEVANLLLSLPVNKEEESREQAIDFLYDWIVGTPDYVFGLGRTRVILGDDLQLQGISFAAQVKYALENNASIRNNSTATLEVWATIAEYIGNRKNRCNLTPKLKELIRADKSGTLEEFIERHE